jgi:hypothetical protein
LATASSPSTPDPAAAVGAGQGRRGRLPPLRARAVPLLLLLLVEALLGNQLAVVGSPYPLGYLVAHVALAVLLVAFSTHVLVLARRLPGVPARTAAWVTFVSTIIATAGGTAFLFGGQSSAALYAMVAFAGVAILGAVLLLVWGSEKLTGTTPSRT